MMPWKGKLETLAQVRTGAGEALLLMGDTAMDIAVSLLLLVIVGRTYGPGGLGIYSFLLSVFVIVTFISEFGIAKWVEREVVSGNLEDVNRLLADAKAAVLLSGLIGCLVTLLVSVQIPAGSTAAGRATAGLWLIALAVPMRLYSGFQISTLQGSARHADAVRIAVTGRAVLLGTVFVLTVFGLRPDLLAVCFVLSEAVSVTCGVRRFRMPSLGNVARRVSGMIDVLKYSVRYYFTQEGLKVLFFVDFFILGFFVTSSREGSYAEASVLARLFLLFPLGAAPLYRVRIYRESETGYGRIFDASRLTAARVFTVHSVVALVFLLYFPAVSRAVFRAQGDIPEFFRVFSLLVPGLLLFSSTIVLEPLFAAGGMERELNGITSRVLILNALLNSYLIPYAGIFGAAVATTVSLVVYFFWFMNRIGPEGAVPVGAYLISGGLVYLGYRFLDTVHLPPLLVLFLAAVLLPFLFSGLGLFERGEEAKRNRHGPENGTRTTEHSRKPGDSLDITPM